MEAALLRWHDRQFSRFLYLLDLHVSCQVRKLAVVWLVLEELSLKAIKFVEATSLVIHSRLGKTIEILRPFAHELLPLVGISDYV